MRRIGMVAAIATVGAAVLGAAPAAQAADEVGPVTVTVTASDGSPAFGWVWLQQVSGGSGVGVQLETGVAYFPAVAADDYLVIAEPDSATDAPMYATADGEGAYTEAEATVYHPGYDVHPEVQVQLEVGATLSGKVANASGAPIEGVGVSPELSGERLPMRADETGAKGGYRITGLPPGGVEVAFTDYTAEYAHRYLHGLVPGTGEPARLRTGAETTVNRTLERAGSVRGTYTDQLGSWFGRAVAYIATGDPNDPWFEYTSASGDGAAFRIDGLPRSVPVRVCAEYTDLEVADLCWNEHGHPSLANDVFAKGEQAPVLEFAMPEIEDGAVDPGIIWVEGRVRVGETLTAVVNGGDADEHLVLWEPADDVDEVLASGDTYRVRASDLGTRLRARAEGYTPGRLVASTAVSTGTVVEGVLDAKRPTIDGRAQVGKTLTADPGGWGKGVAFTYSWFADGKKLKGESGKKLQLGKSDAGTKISVEVTGSKTGYESQSKVSSATGKVAKK